MDTIAELVTKLKEPIPSQFLKSKSVGGHKVAYVPWYRLGDLLDERVGAGNWNWQVVSCLEIGSRTAQWELEYNLAVDKMSWQEKKNNPVEKIKCNHQLILTGTLIIYGSDRSLSMTATGNEDIGCSNYGDPSSNAEAMAMRRCAAKFGLGRYLWDKDKQTLPSSSPPRQNPSSSKPKPQVPSQATNSFASQSQRIIAPYIQEWGKEAVIQSLKEENMPTKSSEFKTQEQITQLRELLENTFSIDDRSEYEATGVGI